MAEISIGNLLMAAARAQRNYLTRALAPHGVHPGQDQLLLAVWNNPALRQSDLARELGVEPPTITRMVARLERSGLVERRNDPTDARATLVLPTQRSRLLEPHVRRVWQEMEAVIAATATAEGTAAGLEVIREALESAGEGQD